MASTLLSPTFTGLVEASVLVLIVGFEVKGLNAINRKIIVCFVHLNTILGILVKISYCFKRYTVSGRVDSVFGMSSSKHLWSLWG